MTRKRIFLATLLLLLPLSVSGQGIGVLGASISELQAALEQGLVTSVELVDQYLARISAYDKQGPALNSIVRINSRASEQAAELDMERTVSGARSLLHGIPILLKDNYNTADMPTTNGSVAFAGFMPGNNATQVALLLQAGAIIIAKTNLHEYARGITSIASLIGQTRNPYDIRRVPGGSSGGTGAAVAASFGAVGMGSDTCGSIRIPASFNNLVGLRPTKGISSIHGIMPLSHTQDTGGPLTRTLEDLAIVLDLTMGYDPDDAATEIMLTEAKPSFLDSLDSMELEGLRFGKVTGYFDRADSAVRQVVDEALEWYESRGVEIVDIEVPFQDELISASGVISYEFEQDLNHYLASNGDPDVGNVDSIVESNLLHLALQDQMARAVAQDLDEQAYAEAMAARTTMRDAIGLAFAMNDLDAMVYPTIGRIPAMIGDPQTGSACQLSAQSGLPALSMSVGFTADGLPVGMELMGRYLRDADLLAMARPYERENHPRRTPSVTPALVNGEAPPVEAVRARFDYQGVALQADFEYSILTNRFTYHVRLLPQSTAELYSAGLIVDTQEKEGLDEAIVLTLLGPGMAQGSGEYFMSAEFREAFTQGKIYFRVFAESMPATGVTQALREPQL